MFGCIRGCSATQSQAEKGRDSIPPIEDEHQQFRPVFSCNPIWRPLSNRISDMGWCTFNYQTRIWDSYPWGCYFSNIPTWQMSPSFRFAKIALVCACCNKFKFQSSTIQLYTILKMMWSGNFHAKLTVHPGVEPGVLTDSVATLICPILLAMPHIFTA